MTTANKIIGLGVLLVIVVGSLVSQFLSVPQRHFYHADYTTNAGEVTSDTLVGQTFVAEKNNLSAIAVQFATYSGRNNTQPVQFQLYTWPRGEVLRSVTVLASELNDNQHYRFSFEPLANSAGQVFFFSITSPASTPGNAVTVDLDTRNPYHRGSAFLVRPVSAAPLTQADLERGGKPTIDVSFATFYQVPLRVAVVDASRAFIQTVVRSWPSQQNEYQALATSGLSAITIVLLIGLCLLPARLFDRKGVRVGMLLVLMAAGAYLRFWYAQRLPTTSDEGSYLYDAATLLRGKLAGGDGYVKAPLVIAWLAAWQWLLGSSVVFARAASIAAGALTTLPLYAVGFELVGRKTGILTAALWALSGASVLAGVYAHTQPLAILLGCSAVAVLLSGLRREHPGKLFWAGVLFGVAVMARKSMLALGFIPLVFVLIEKRNWAPKLYGVGRVGVGFALMMVLFLGGAWWVYGVPGIWEATGTPSASDSFTCDDASAEELRAYSIRGFTPLLREAAPLIILTCIGLGIFMERTVRSIMKRFIPEVGTLGQWLLRDSAVPKLVWITIAFAYTQVWNFFVEYEAQRYMVYGLASLWFYGALLLAVVALWPATKRPEFKKPDPYAAQPLFLKPPATVSQTYSEYLHPTSRRFTAWLVPALWLLGLTVFYSNWLKFHANYLSEFIPPLTIAAGMGVAVGSRLLMYKRAFTSSFMLRIPALAVFLGVTTWALFTSNYSTYTFEHTGTFSIEAVQAAAAWTKANIPPDEPLFTGGTLIAYASGHRTSLDISHATWYGYDCIRRNSVRLHAFMPSLDEMLAAYREAEWYVEEEKTIFSFGREYDLIRNTLPLEFVRRHGISNGSNTITFYQRLAQ